MPEIQSRQFREPRLLQTDDPPPVTTLNSDGRSPVLLLCDHASNAVPRGLANLGLTADKLDRHIAFDIGAALVTRRLVEKLDAPALVSGYSRLVIDCNRPIGSPSSILALSDGTAVPGNLGLSNKAAAMRAAEIFEPYHHAVDARIETMLAAGTIPVVAAVHSFTRRMEDVDRPWQIGILSNQDRRFADFLLSALRADGDLVVGDNEPYSGMDAVGYTVETHAEPRGLPHATIEIRDDLIEEPAAAQQWADRLAGILRRWFDDQSRQRRSHPVRDAEA